jgi:2-polyprenyl-3-methyl-5-hydroxy-6-metoxy-1,4-benzoquinol methylase
MDIQRMQDCIWDHYQVEAAYAFDMSYPRLHYLASKFKKKQSVLNIGVGNGYLEERMQRAGIDIHALDPSQKTIDQLKSKIPLGDKGRVGYSQDIPFPAACFDGVIMTEVLEHLTCDPLHQTLSEVYRILKPGGRFIGTVPYREDMMANQILCPCCHTLFHRWGHHQFFDREKLTGILSSAGFRIIKVYPRAFPDWRRLKIKLLIKSVGRYILGRMGETIVSPNLYFEVRKPS